MSVSISSSPAIARALALASGPGTICLPIVCSDNCRADSICRMALSTGLVTTLCSRSDGFLLGVVELCACGLEFRAACFAAACDPLLPLASIAAAAPSEALSALKSALRLRSRMTSSPSFLNSRRSVVSIIGITWHRAASSVCNDVAMSAARNSMPPRRPLTTASRASSWSPSLGAR